MNNIEIRDAKTDEEIEACYPLAVLLEGRRAGLSAQAFVNQVKRQREQAGFTLSYMVDQGTLVAMAGYRFCEFLAWGKVLYVDDLVTKDDARSKGYGARMLDRLLDVAKEEECEEIHLDSGCWRVGAHKFYFKHGFHIGGFHFLRKLI